MEMLSPRVDYNAAGMPRPGSETARGFDFGMAGACFTPDFLQNAWGSLRIHFPARYAHGQECGNAHGKLCVT